MIEMKKNTEASALLEQYSKKLAADYEHQIHTSNKQQLETKKEHNFEIETLGNTSNKKLQENEQIIEN